MKLLPKLNFKDWNWWDYTKLVIALLLVTGAYMQITRKGDFYVFLKAADILRQGRNPYHIWILDRNCLYLYSPFFAMLLVPFRYLPDILVNFLWISACLWFTYRNYQLIRQYLPANFPKRWQNELLLIIPFVFVIRFWLYNIQYLQMTIFMLWCMLESIELFRKDRYWLGGFLLALSINIKILPVVLLPYLFLRMKWKAFIPIVLFSLLFLLSPAIFFGFSFNFELHANWWNEINPSQGKQYAIEADLGPHSLNALLPSLLMKTDGDYPLERNLLDLPQGTVLLLVNAIRLLLVAATLYFTGIRPAKERSAQKTIRELSYIILLIPLIFPHQQKYAFYLIFPAMMYLSWFLVQAYQLKFTTVSKTRWRMLIVLLSVAFVLMVLTTDGLIGWKLALISQHFKLITYGALLLGLALALSPEKQLVSPEAENA